LGRAPGGREPRRGFLRCQQPYCLIGVLQSQYTSAKISFVEVNPNRFKELRTVRGLSVRKLAAKAGVSTETIYSLEHGRREFIWPKTARKLAQALEVDPAELVEDA
jgi:DNA-binding XRE family transcriptional regulator